MSARTWWLDVEESHYGTLWGEDPDANVAVLQGWRAELERTRHDVGVYSTYGYWAMITGGWSVDLPQWVAVGESGFAAAQAACAQPFTTGPVVLTQWLTGPLDGNLVCPGQGPVGRDLFGPWSRAKTTGVPELLLIPVPHPHPELGKPEKRDKGKKAKKAKRHDKEGRGTATSTPLRRADRGPIRSRRQRRLRLRTRPQATAGPQASAGPQAPPHPDPSPPPQASADPDTDADPDPDAEPPPRARLLPRPRRCRAENPGRTAAAPDRRGGDASLAHRRPGERPGEPRLLGPAPLPLRVGRRHGRPEQLDHVAARPVGSVVPVGQVEDVHHACGGSWTPADRLPGVLPQAVPDQVQSPLDRL